MQEKLLPGLRNLCTKCQRKGKASTLRCFAPALSCCSFQAFARFQPLCEKVCVRLDPCSGSCKVSKMSLTAAHRALPGWVPGAAPLTFARFLPGLRNPCAKCGNSSDNATCSALVSRHQHLHAFRACLSNCVRSTAAPVESKPSDHGSRDPAQLRHSSHHVADLRRPFPRTVEGPAK